MSHKHTDDLRDCSSRDAAAQWYVDFQMNDELREPDQREWSKWSESDENLSAFDRFAHLHQQMVALAAPALATDEELLTSPFAVDARAITQQDGRGPRSSLSRWVQMPLVACLLAAAVLGALWVPFLAHRVAGFDRQFTTAAGEQREVMLPDGSAVTLGGDTSIEIRYGLWERQLLLERGEGLFNVAHQNARPFTVCTNVACTTAVGTIFDVRVYAARVNVWVQQGAVSVSPRTTTRGEDKPLRLLRDQELSYDRQGMTNVKAVGNPLLQRAWTTGELIYHSRPLAEVLEDVQRYSARPIYLDPAAGVHFYTGSVLQAYISDWLRGLASVYAVRVVDCQHSPITDSAATTEEDQALCSQAADRILIRPL